MRGNGADERISAGGGRLSSTQKLANRPASVPAITRAGRGTRRDPKRRSAGEETTQASRGAATTCSAPMVSFASPAPGTRRYSRRSRDPRTSAPSATRRARWRRRPTMFKIGPKRVVPSHVFDKTAQNALATRETAARGLRPLRSVLSARRDVHGRREQAADVQQRDMYRLRGSSNDMHTGNAGELPRSSRGRAGRLTSRKHRNVMISTWCDYD